MKKRLTLLCAILLCTRGIYAQSCASAQSLLSYVNGSTLSQSGKEEWYYFNALYQNMLIDVLKIDTTFKQVDSVFAYSGSCGSLTLMKSYGRPVGNDSIYGMELRLNNLTVSNTYRIRIKLKATPPSAVRYAMYMTAAAAAGSCDMVTNGDMENTNNNPCPWGNGCTPGTYIIPSWETGSHQWGMMHSTNASCLPNFSGIPHSGTICGALDVGPPTPPPLILHPVFSYDNHSYLRVNFTPLTPGRYYVQMFYSKEPQRMYAGDGLGMFLSVNPPVITPPPANWSCGTHILPAITPQFDNPTGNYMTNTNWLPMGGIYTTISGGEDYLTIGNFKWGGATNFSLVSSPTASLGGSQYLIDDVSITPMDFTIRPVSICSGMVTQLTPSLCTPPYCTSTYSWSPSTALSSPNSMNTAASPTVTTTYTLTHVVTNTLGIVVATNTAAVTITVTPSTFTWSAGATSQVICSNLGQSAVTLTAGSTYNLQYVWNPGSLLGSSIPVSPTVTTVYTVQASIGTCVYTKTVSVAVNTICCTSTVGLITTANITGQTIYGPAVINQDLLISGNAISTFRDGEFLIAPGVRITVMGGSQLELRGAHLYSCTNDMWQGIDVLMNGRVLAAATATNSTFIEDAIAAVNINNIQSVPTMSLAELNGTVFNRNYVAVSINNGTTNAMPVTMINNVITSRTLTFTATQWPGTSIAGSGLRVPAVSTPTTGLQSPYDMQGAALANLKNPYSNQPAHMGVRIINVGNPTGLPSYGVVIGESVTYSSLKNFNVFDAIGYGIYAENSNVTSVNNVFQNMQRYTIPSGTYGGDGIHHECLNQMNTRLDLRDPVNTPNLSAGNRFWNCYNGVYGRNIYEFYSVYSLYRSSQSSAGGTGLLPGNMGINITTSRFSYLIENNTFNNVRYGVNIPVIAGQNNVSGSQFGVYAGPMWFFGNYFGAQPSSSVAIGTAYMNTGISVSSPNNAVWQTGFGSLAIVSNNVNRSFRGIVVNGMNSFMTTLQTNSISLVFDNMWGGNQRGIELVNSLNNVTVLTNTITGFNISNTLTTLMYAGSNVGSGSPSICCNYLDNGYKGFEFNSNNGGTVWKGNTMNALGRGLVLSAVGVIGQQGAAGMPSDNQWTNFPGGSNGTWTEGGSNAFNSKLWIRNTLGVWLPPNNNGVNAPISYLAAGNLSSTTPSTIYACAAPNSPPPAFLMAPNPGGEESEDMLYSSGTSLYRYLDANPDQLENSENLENFYDSLALGSVGKFSQVENYLYEGNQSQAISVNAQVLPSNNVEANYQQYYTLYNNHMNGAFSTQDSTDLYNLANLCPGSDGPCVYQARALYNYIYSTVLQITENCVDLEEQGARRFTTNVPNNTKIWTVDLFPNPSEGKIQITSKTKTGVLEIMVKDLSGRLLMNKPVSLQDYQYFLDLDLKDGVYLVILKNSNHETVTKKLVIAH